MLTHFSLFTGIGGIDLAAEWAGFKTIGQCEWADYPTKVLEKHWPDVPRWRDIRSVTAESVNDRGIGAIDIISGGFPCQPFSVAGNQKGKEDDRYLWPEMLRVVRELTPRWVICENVPGILRIAGKTVCEDLEREGYAVTVLNFEAAAIGAKHRRDRCFFVANAKSEQSRRIQQFGFQPNIGTSGNAMENAWGSGFGRARNVCDIRELQERPIRQGQTNIIEQSGEVSSDVANTNSERLQARNEQGSLNEESGKIKPRSEFERISPASGWVQWAVEPDVGRVANGIPSRVDRLKCLGNAVVPQQVYPILKAIYDIEMALSQR